MKSAYPEVTLNGRITVAQIVHSLTLGGGVQHVVCTSASHLDPKRFRVIICCLAGRGELADRLEEEGYEVVVFDGKSSTDPRYAVRNLTAMWKLSELLRREQVQVVQTHEFFSGTVGRTAARLAGVPVILLMLHVNDRWKKRKHILVDRLMARWTDKIITNSHAVAEYAIERERLPDDKVVTIYNGIDMGQFGPVHDVQSIREGWGATKDTFVFSTIGRFTAQKGHVYLLEAIRQVIGQCPDIRLVIVGDDDPFEASTRGDFFGLARLPELQDRVLFLGWREDVPAILQASDALVMPSLWEGFGLVAAEAMAAGKPVIASKVDAIPEVVVHGLTGILVPPKEPAALAEAMVKLVRDRDLAHALGDAGRARVEANFSARAMAEKLASLYEELVARKMVGAQQ